MPDRRPEDVRGLHVDRQDHEDKGIGKIIAAEDDANKHYEDAEFPCTIKAVDLETGRILWEDNTVSKRLDALWYRNGVLMAQAGAGIVADSIPEQEYLETSNKIAALKAAIKNAERGLR